jgi:hypothetical protein
VRHPLPEFLILDLEQCCAQIHAIREYHNIFAVITTMQAVIKREGFYVTSGALLIALLFSNVVVCVALHCTTFVRQPSIKD